MKYLSTYIGVLFTLFSIVMCSSSETLKFNQEQELFISEFSGGSKERGFKILNSEQEFRMEYSRLKSGEVLSKDISIPKFPDNQKVVLYQLGEFRSGDHRVLGIDSLKIENNLLEVYIKRNEVKPGRDMMQIQVVTTPWIMFSVPKDYQFNKVELR